MERYLREVIGNYLTLNSPPYFWVYNIFVDKTYVWRFYTSDQIWVFIFWHFLKFSLICDFNFWQISPPWIYVQKMIYLNHFLVNSSAKKQSQKS